MRSLDEQVQEIKSDVLGIAAELGRRTLLPSMELGCDPIFPIEDMGYSTVYGGHVAWSAPDRPVLKEIVPKQAFDRLFRYFEANPGQWPKAARFVYRDARSSVILSPAEAAMVVAPQREAAAVTTVIQLRSRRPPARTMVLLPPDSVPYARPIASCKHRYARPCILSSCPRNRAQPR